MCFIKLACLSAHNNVLLCLPQSLSVDEVKGLLGTNLADLASYENQTLVRSWISVQPQSQLNTLGLGLTGGLADSTTSSDSSSNAVTATTSSSSAAGNSTAGSTTPSGECYLRCVQVITGYLNIQPRDEILILSFSKHNYAVSEALCHYETP